MRDGHLQALLDRATVTMLEALRELDDVHRELTGLVQVRLGRHWNGEELIRYGTLVTRRRSANRRYEAARVWHEAIRQHIRRAEFGETCGPPVSRPDRAGETIRKRG